MNTNIYHRTIKGLLKKKFAEINNSGGDFNLSEELEKANNIYNNLKHSTIGLSPNMIFNSKNELLFQSLK